MKTKLTLVQSLLTFIMIVVAFLVLWAPPTQTAPNEVASSTEEPPIVTTQESVAFMSNLTITELDFRLTATAQQIQTKQAQEVNAWQATATRQAQIDAWKATATKQAQIDAWKATATKQAQATPITVGIPGTLALREISTAVCKNLCKRDFSIFQSQFQESEPVCIQWRETGRPAGQVDITIDVRFNGTVIGSAQLEGRGGNVCRAVRVNTVGAGNYVTTFAYRDIGKRVWWRVK